MLVLEAPGLQRFKADFSLLMVALVWGLTFVTVKNAIADMAPFTFIAIRFAMAFVFMAIICIKKLLKVNRREVLLSGFAGVFLFIGYSFQTLGLQYTTASNAGFITGLSVVLVPIIVSISNRRMPSPLALLGAVLAAVGLGFMTLNEGYSYNYGDILVLGCAICFALHIVFIARFASEVDASVMTTIQIGTVAVLSVFAALVFESSVPIRFTTDVWIGLLTTAIPATALAFFIQTWSQRFTTPMHTAIILSTEPVFSGIFGFLLLNEVLGSRALFGAALVLTGMILSEVREIHSEKDKETKKVTEKGNVSCPEVAYNSTDSK